MRKRQAVRRRAFTLLEVLMVIVILGVLVAFVAKGLMGAGERAKEDATKQLVESGLAGAIDRFQLHMGRLPTSIDELLTKPSDETQASKWEGPYTSSKNVGDAFGTPWHYTAPGANNTNSYDLSSAGRDMQWGTSDDINNWTTK